MGKEVELSEKEIRLLHSAINARIDMRKNQVANSNAEKRQIDYCNEMLMWFQHSCVYLRNPYAQALLTGIIQEYLLDIAEQQITLIKNKYCNKAFNKLSFDEIERISVYNEVVNLYNRIATRKNRKNLLTINQFDSKNKG